MGGVNDGCQKAILYTTPSLPTSSPVYYLIGQDTDIWSYFLLQFPFSSVCRVKIFGSKALSRINRVTVKCQ